MVSTGKGSESQFNKKVQEAIDRKYGFNKIVCPKCKVKNPPDRDSCRKCGYSFRDSRPIRTKNEEPEGSSESSSGIGEY